MVLGISFARANYPVNNVNPQVAALDNTANQVEKFMNPIKHLNALSGSQSGGLGGGCAGDVIKSL